MSASDRYGFFQTFGIALIAGAILAVVAFFLFTFLEGSSTRAQYEETPFKNSVGKPTYVQTKGETAFDGKIVAWATMISFALGFVAIFLLNYVPALTKLLARATGVKPEGE